MIYDLNIDSIQKWWNSISVMEQEYLSESWLMDKSDDKILLLCKNIVEVYSFNHESSLDKRRNDLGSDFYEYLVNHELFEPEIIEWWSIGGGYSNSWLEVLYNGSNYKTKYERGRLYCDGLPI